MELGFEVRRKAGAFWLLLFQRDHGFVSRVTSSSMLASTVYVSAWLLLSWHERYHPDSGPLQVDTVAELDAQLGEEGRAAYASLTRATLARALSLRQRPIAAGLEVRHDWLEKHARPARLLKRPAGAAAGPAVKPLPAQVSQLLLPRLLQGARRPLPGSWSCEAQTPSRRLVEPGIAGRCAISVWGTLGQRCTSDCALGGMGRAEKPAKSGCVGISEATVCWMAGWLRIVVTGRSFYVGFI